MIRCRGGFELSRAADKREFVEAACENELIGSEGWKSDGLMKVFRVKNRKLLKRHDIKPVVVRIEFVVDVDVLFHFKVVF